MDCWTKCRQMIIHLPGILKSTHTQVELKKQVRWTKTRFPTYRGETKRHMQDNSKHNTEDERGANTVHRQQTMGNSEALFTQQR